MTLCYVVQLRWPLHIHEPPTSNIHANVYITLVTPKRITYSDHALEQLRKRGITRPVMQWLLARGIRQTTLTVAGAQRWSCRGCIGHAEAEVIFIEDAHEIHVITAMWLD